MRVSKFVKANRDILIEYIYDDGNNISESYSIIKNLRDNTQFYIAGDSSSSGNTKNNQLLLLDPVTNNYGLVDENVYTFLQIKDYASGFPVRNDTMKVHLPVNWTFGEYLGFYVKIYTYDYNNRLTYDLSNFYFDITDVDQSYLLNFNSPALYLQEKLWDKNITINIPSVYAVARQRVNDNQSPKQNSLNSNLTNNLGLSLDSPIFIDFHFITQKRTINSVTTYNLTARNPISLPQAPDFENIGVQINHSMNGDYFEIFGVYNGNINEFDNFIQNSVLLGQRYYVNYIITLYEQNIRGKSFTITVTDNFNEKVEYRPIIKYSTTTAIVDVEMNLIDKTNGSTIVRRASYGMLQDEVSKYSLNLTKINLNNASKPKIYNIKSPEGAGIFGNKLNNVSGMRDNKPQIILEPIKVNYTVLVDKYNLVAKSDNVLVGKDNFYGIGKLELLLQPFDNILKFKIAQDIRNEQNGSESVLAPKYMDLTGMGEINLVIKNQKLTFETGLYIASNEVDLTIGSVVFKIQSSRMNDVRKIYESGVNLFYITSKTDTGTVVVYSGLFKIYDTFDNIEVLRRQAVESRQNSLQSSNRPTVIEDPELASSATAFVTRRLVSSTNNVDPQKKRDTTSSVPNSVKINNVTYTIGSDSSLTINGFSYTSGDIKAGLGLSSNPINLSIKSDGLYSNDQYLDKLSNLNSKLSKKVIKTEAQKTRLEQTQQDFITNQKRRNV